MYSENTRKTKAALFDADDARYYDIFIRFVPLTMFMIAISVILRIELYFSFFNLNCDVYTTAYIFMAVIGITQLFFSSQKFFSTTIFGMLLSTAVSMEACLLLILAQYHPVLAVLTAFLSVGAYFGIRHLVRRLNEPNRGRIRNFNKKCRKLAFRLSSVVVALALIIPAFAGFFKEFYSDTLTDEEWSDFLEWYSSFEAQEKDVAEDPNEELLSDLARWEELSISDKERLIRIIAQLEKEHLGISQTDIEVNTEKMEKYTLAYYSPATRDVYVNYRYLNETELSEAIITILHELHHAYVYHTIEALDFDSPEVQGSFYYESARQWKENSESYISAGISFDAYYNQPIERDAREYAEERVNFYMAYADTESTPSS